MSIVQNELEAFVRSKTAELVSRLLSEIENLQRKLAAKEQEGWEGSQRRLRLKREAQDFIKTHSQSDRP